MLRSMPRKSLIAKQSVVEPKFRAVTRSKLAVTGQFGDCWIRMEPLDRGAGFEFGNEVFGGSIPRNFIPAIEKGIQETAVNGYLAGYPVVDFKVTVYDGSYHDVDSSEMAFKLAARKAFKAAMAACKPALLEPIMNVEVHAPVEYAGRPDG